VEYNVDDFTFNFFPFVVTVDETFLPLSPRIMLENNLFTNVSVLIGSNNNEGFWSLMYLLPDLFPNNELTMRDRMITDEKYQEATGQIFPFYPKTVIHTTYLLGLLKLDSVDRFPTKQD
jgi:carboxylesterase type B